MLPCSSTTGCGKKKPVHFVIEIFKLESLSQSF